MVNAGYRIMNLPKPQISNWSWKHIGRVKIPYKVACFAWLLASKAVLTHENVIKGGTSLCSRCFYVGMKL